MVVVVVVVPAGKTFKLDQVRRGTRAVTRGSIGIGTCGVGRSVGWVG